MILGDEPSHDSAMESKLELARRIVARWHGAAAAAEAEAHFTKVVREGRTPDVVPEAPLPDGDPVHLPSLLVDVLGISTTSEARRLLAQNGVRVDDEVVTELDLPRERLAGAVVQAGKRRYVRFTSA
jgi:tyrosyl-tRNA synthetase